MPASILNLRIQIDTENRLLGALILPCLQHCKKSFLFFFQQSQVYCFTVYISVMPRTLLVIDLQQELVDGTHPSWGERSTPNLTSNVSKILALWRHHGWPIIHIHHDDPDPEHPLRYDKPETASAHPCSAPSGDELILRKSTGSAFVSTPLEEELKRRGGKELVVIGMDSSQCVSDNTRNAVDLGFSNWVVADACAGYGFSDYRDPKKRVSAEEVHHAAMGMLENGYAKVLFTEELLKMFAEKE